MLLALNSIAHFLVDALCISTLFGPAAATGDIGIAVVLYNTLAFSTQCIVGLLADAVRHHSWSAAISMILVVLGWVLPLPALMKVCFVGLGNSIFHVAGGAMTLEASEGRAGKLGVFVAPGAFGVTLGTLYPQVGLAFALAAILCAAVYIYISTRKPEILPAKCPQKAAGKFPVLAVILLTAAVAVRAVGGTAVSFPWKTGAGMAIMMTAFVFVGKTAGGFVCDKLGAKKMSWVSIPLSAIMIAFCSGHMIPSFLGQFLLNLSMPVTLYLIYKAMPDSPGFAFGLAASALWPGTIAGQLLTLTGPALWICVIGCFAFGLAAIIYADNKLRRTKV